MNQRQIIWLGGALVLLLGIAYLAGVFDSDFSTVDVPEVNVAASEVTSIRVAGPDVDVALVKRDGRWRLTEPVADAADSTTVARLLEDLDEMALQSVVSTSPDRHARFGVDTTGTELTVEWEGGSESFVVGDQNAGAKYVRMAGGDAVYLTSGRLRVPASADDWRDKTIVDVEPERVRRVSVVGPDRFTVLERHPEGWTLTAAGEPMQADSAAIQRYLDRFHPIKADAFLASAPASSDSSYSVRIELSAGGEHRIELMPVESDYAVTLDGGGTAYRVRSFRLSQIAPEASSLADD